MSLGSSKSIQRKFFREKTRLFLQENNPEILAQKARDRLQNLIPSSGVCVALYISLKNEIKVHQIKDIYPCNRYLYPRLSQAGIEFVESPQDDKEVLFKKKAGFFQPTRGWVVDIQDIDIFVIPGVAFDQDFTRLGRGYGFFDRALSKASPQAIKIAVAYNTQMKKDGLLPLDHQDIKMDVIVTPRWTLFSTDFFEKRLSRKQLFREE